MKLWQGIVLGLLYLFVGYLVARKLLIPLDARSSLFVCLLTLVVAVLLLTFLSAADRRALFRVRRPLLRWTLYLWVGQLLVAPITLVLTYWFAPSRESSALLSGPLVLVMLAVMILGPIDEELIFRGGLTQGLCRRIPWKGGIVIPAVLFMLCHHWTQIFQTLVLGLLLGYLCWYTGSIAYGILIHVLFNSTCFVVSLFYGLLLWNGPVGTAVSLLAVAGGLVLTLWALRGFTRCADLPER